MKRKILSDIILNMLASAFPIIALQFLLLPLVASKIDSNSYGYLITIVSWMNLSALTLGSVLNNSRLIFNNTYEELNIKGDFSILLGVFFLINIFVMAAGLWYFEISFDLINILIIIFTSMFMLVKGYGIVEFRIKLNYKYILFDSLFTTIGHGIGFILFWISGYWQFIYLIGSAISLLFVFNKTNILREPFRKTCLFKKTALQTYSLLFSGLLNTTTVYLDKLLLFPLLGGLTVSIYYTATIVGKTLALAIGPITGVFLSYISRLKKINNNSVLLILIASFLIGTLGYFVVMFISEPILNLLYPQFAKDALNYIYVTTISIIIIIISDILNAVLLKFCDLKWQMMINSLYLLMYILLSLIFLNFYGLIGFCFGILIASIIKLISMIVVYYLTNVKTKTEIF